MRSLNFPGLRHPSTDFDAVRTQLQTLPFYVDIDLSSARSLSDGSALLLNAAGNSVYCDKQHTTGQADFYFQDTGSQGSTPIAVDAGFIAHVEFAQIVVTNTAQPGKKIRLIYGVDLTFTPGTQSSVEIIGNASVTIAQGGTITNGTPATVGTTEVALCAASASRKSVRFFNSGTATIYIGGTGVTTANGMPIAAGAGWSEDDGAAAAWYAISGSAGQTVRVQEVS